MTKELLMRIWGVDEDDADDILCYYEDIIDERLNYDLHQDALRTFKHLLNDLSIDYSEFMEWAA